MSETPSEPQEAPETPDQGTDPEQDGTADTSAE